MVLYLFLSDLYEWKHTHERAKKTILGYETWKPKIRAMKKQ